jgi:small subunit ribosomal protein S23
MDLIPNDVLQILRPVQQAVKEVGVLIDASPWKYLAAPQASSAAPPPSITQAMIHTGLQQALSGMSVNVSVSPSGPTSGPYVTPLPATPLSAALGPAAQATVPSSSIVNPARNGMFIGNGNVFDRADSNMSLANRTMSSQVPDSHGQTPTLLSPLVSRSHPRYVG